MILIFWIGKWLECLILVGFDDMGYDKCFGGWNLGFCLILKGILNEFDSIYRQSKIKLVYR